MAQFILSLLLVATVPVGSRHASKHDDTELKLTRKRISPILEPKSDKKFFGKDYPFDKRSVTDEYYVFGHPYPAVQDGSDYDRDFVKDENSDNGQWDAQMHYDTLRQKINKEKKKLQELKERMETEYKEWMDASRRAQNAGKETRVVDGKLKDAKVAEEAARNKVNDLEGSSSADGTAPGGVIGEAVTEVEDEMSDLEKCKEALKKAKQKLKRLLKEQEEAAKKAKELKVKEDQEQEEAAKREKEQKDKEDKLKKEEEEKARALKAGGGAGVPADGNVWDEKAWRKELEYAKKEHAEALRNYEKELTQVKRTKDQLARAAENLKKFRRPPYVDDDGGVYDVPKSSAFLPRTLVALVSVAFTIYVF